MKILLTIEITGEAAEHYMDVHEAFIFEDFVGRFNESDVGLVSCVKEDRSE